MCINIDSKANAGPKPLLRKKFDRVIDLNWVNLNDQLVAKLDMDNSDHVFGLFDLIDELKGSFLSQIGKGVLDKTWIRAQKKKFAPVAHLGEGEILKRFINIAIRLTLAQQEMELGGENARAWYWLVTAQQSLFKAFKMKWIEGPETSTSALASRGGNGRAKHSKAVKKEAIRLVKTSPLKNTWPDAKTAVLGIVDDLKVYVKAEGILLKPDLLHIRLTTWLRPDSEGNEIRDEDGYTFKERIIEAMK